MKAFQEIFAYVMGKYFPKSQSGTCFGKEVALNMVEPSASAHGHRLWKCNDESCFCMAAYYFVKGGLVNSPIIY